MLSLSPTSLVTLTSLPRNPEKPPVPKANINLNSLQSLFNGDRTDEETPIEEEENADVDLLKHFTSGVPETHRSMKPETESKLDGSGIEPTELKKATKRLENKRSLSRQATRIMASREGPEGMHSQISGQELKTQSRKQSKVGISLDTSLLPKTQQGKVGEVPSLVKISQMLHSAANPGTGSSSKGESRTQRPTTLEQEQAQIQTKRHARSVSSHAVHEMAFLVRDVDRIASNLQERLFLKPKSVFEEYQQQQAKKRKDEKKQAARRLLAQRSVRQGENSVPVGFEVDKTQQSGERASISKQTFIDTGRRAVAASTSRDRGGTKSVDPRHRNTPLALPLI